MAEVEPRYSEKQVAAILRRAAEIQFEGGRASDTPGVAGSELVQIGPDLGLDAASIRAAIEELESGKMRPPRQGLIPGPTQVEMERSYESDLTDEAWENMVALFRKRFSKVGTVSVVGGVREWSGGERELDSLHLSARQQGSTLRVRVLSDISAAAFLIAFLFAFPLLMCVMGVASVKELEVWARAVLATLLTLSGIGLWRWVYGSMCRRRERVLSETLSKLRTVLPSPGERAESFRQASELEVDEEADLRVGEA